MDQGYGSRVWIKGMDHAISQGMDQSMDRGVWIVCSFGALIHTLYFDSYPYSFLVGSGSDVCVNSPSLPGVGGRGRSPLIFATCLKPVNCIMLLFLKRCFVLMNVKKKRWYLRGFQKIEYLEVHKTL